MLWEIKEILFQIIDYTYLNKVPDFQIKKYKSFYLELKNTTCRTSYGGLYRCDIHKITVCNFSTRDNTAIFCTIIHELAHHIDSINSKNKGNHGHQKEFYAIYKELLFTALDLEYIIKEDILNLYCDASDSRKVKKMVKDYQLKPLIQKFNYFKVIVLNSFEIEDYLKINCFKYNSVCNEWERIFTIDEYLLFKDELLQFVHQDDIYYYYNRPILNTKCLISDVTQFINSY